MLGVLRFAQTLGRKYCPEMKPVHLCMLRVETAMPRVYSGR